MSLHQQEASTHRLPSGHHSSLSNPMGCNRLVCGPWGWPLRQAMPSPHQGIYSPLPPRAGGLSILSPCLNLGLCIKQILHYIRGFAQLCRSMQEGRSIPSWYLNALALRSLLDALDVPLYCISVGSAFEEPIRVKRFGGGHGRSQIPSRSLSIHKISETSAQKMNFLFSRPKESLEALKAGPQQTPTPLSQQGFLRGW